MSVIITFDIEGAPTIERNRIQSFFERFGWENLGGSSYRYPRLGTEHPTEDWFNHVIPALMCFRAYVLTNRPVSKFTIDVQSSTGYNPNAGFGSSPLPCSDDIIYIPTNTSFGKKKLTQWLNGIAFPYPPNPAAGDDDQDDEPENE
jgi:hypothetical protein